MTHHFRPSVPDQESVPPYSYVDTPNAHLTSMTAMESYKREQQQRQLQQQLLREQRERLEQLAAQQEADAALLTTTAATYLSAAKSLSSTTPATAIVVGPSTANGVANIVAGSGAAPGLGSTSAAVGVAAAAASAPASAGDQDTAANSSQAGDSVSLVPSGPRPLQMMIAPGEVAELRRQVALENLQNQRMDNLEQDVPVEFECCFCTTKGYPRCQGECIPLRANSV